MLRPCDFNLIESASKVMSPATRLKHRDYSAPGHFFITACANYKQCIFGKATEIGVEPSELGRIVSECWTAIPIHFARVRMHSFMLMPNHLHGIIEISATVLLKERLAQHAVPLQEVRHGALRNTPAGSLSAIVRSFKAEVTRRARLELSWKGDVWQRNYFDRVIRDGQEYANACRYIAENPARWIAGGKALGGHGRGQERLAQHAVPLQSRDRNLH